MPDGIFDDLINLNTLDLSRNQISALPAGVFDQLANLETLRLQNNRLASLPDGIFDRLMNLRNEVELSGNPLSIEISLSPTILEVAEGNAGTTNANLQVRISQAYAEAITVRYTTQDGTATSGLDYTTTSGMLTFPAGTTSLTQTISIPIRGDTLDEPPSKSFRLILSNPNNAVFPNNANTLQSTITILDDNPVCRPVPAEFSLPSLIFSADRLTISEGQTAIYQVRGVTARVSDMIVRIRSSHPQLIVEPRKLIFTTTTLLNFQTIQVRATANAADIDEPISIVHSIDASEGFVAHENAGALSVSISSPAAAIEADELGSEGSSENAAIEPPLIDYDQDDNGLIEEKVGRRRALRSV